MLVKLNGTYNYPTLYTGALIAVFPALHLFQSHPQVPLFGVRFITIPQTNYLEFTLDAPRVLWEGTPRLKKNRKPFNISPRSKF